ncbi:MAG: bifunctional UDP-N-acetylglucosamine diphosphorylase/glucosamine-1-phosphate N-acetyltransferase GlmU [bacterium]
MEGLAIVVLAAGEGKRMKSKLPKVLHRVGGRPMIESVLENARGVPAERTVVVVGFGGEMVVSALKGWNGIECVWQREQLGTGHAVMQAERAVAGARDVLVIYGDIPLCPSSTLVDLVELHRAKGAHATVLTATLEDPSGYGRVIRGDSGEVLGIVEERDADPQQRAIKEINTGIGCFDRKLLFDALARIGADNDQGEYYLTDVIGILARDGRRVQARIAEDPIDVMGINSRQELALANSILRERINSALMLSGVTILDPTSAFVDSTATVGRDTVIYPFTFIEGGTAIGEGCVIGPSTRVANSWIEDEAVVEFSVVEGSRVRRGAHVGPYAHVGPGADLQEGARIGGFVEVGGDYKV